MDFVCPGQLHSFFFIHYSSVLELDCFYRSASKKRNLVRKEGLFSLFLNFCSFFSTSIDEEGEGKSASCVLVNEVYTYRMRYCLGAKDKRWRGGRDRL